MRSILHLRLEKGARARVTCLCHHRHRMALTSLFATPTALPQAAGWTNQQNTLSSSLETPGQEQYLID